ncbi:unnamed protein product [Rotaria magnacalcarata]|uniref:Integrase zinc-binding domain-containing protein n=1 Tax=Rotaria magnacalcarata TaxID=392030 RepID=A0A819WZG8_9BILA|nr:unnamed protein product [Rotaria magnacalcarata]
MNIFYETLDVHIHNLNEKFRAKYVITEEMYENIPLVLRDSCGDAQFKYWAQKYFTLVKIGDPNVVYNHGRVSRPVVTYEELYTKLYESHNRVGHHGRDKTWEEVFLYHIYVFQLFSLSTTSRHDPSDFYRSDRNDYDRNYSYRYDQGDALWGIYI